MIALSSVWETKIGMLTFPYVEHAEGVASELDVRAERRDLRLAKVEVGEAVPLPEGIRRRGRPAREDGICVLVHAHDPRKETLAVLRTRWLGEI